MQNLSSEVYAVRSIFSQKRKVVEQAQSQMMPSPSSSLASIITLTVRFLYLTWTCNLNRLAQSPTKTCPISPRPPRYLDTSTTSIEACSGVTLMRGLCIAVGATKGMAWSKEGLFWIRSFATAADWKQKEPMVRSLKTSTSKGAEECVEMLKS